MIITQTTQRRNKPAQYWFIFLLGFSLILFSCYTAEDKEWQPSKISNTLQQLFPADSVLLLHQAAAAADKSDSIGLPVPLFKAFIKEKNATGYEFIFYFYAGNPNDTAIFIPLMKSIMIHDIKVSMGNKTPDYLVTMPFFDSTGANKMLAIALSAASTKDSVYLSGKQRQILTAFGLKAISAKPALVK
jgi:hypothetical protein